MMSLLEVLGTSAHVGAFGVVAEMTANPEVQALVNVCVEQGRHESQDRQMQMSKSRDFFFPSAIKVRSNRTISRRPPMSPPTSVGLYSKGGNLCRAHENLVLPTLLIAHTVPYWPGSSL